MLGDGAGARAGAGVPVATTEVDTVRTIEEPKADGLEFQKRILSIVQPPVKPRSDEANKIIPFLNGYCRSARMGVSYKTLISIDQLKDLLGCSPESSDEDICRQLLFRVDLFASEFNLVKFNIRERDGRVSRYSLNLSAKELSRLSKAFYLFLETISIDPDLVPLKSVVCIKTDMNGRDYTLNVADMILQFNHLAEHINSQATAVNGKGGYFPFSGAVIDLHAEEFGKFDEAKFQESLMLVLKAFSGVPFWLKIKVMAGKRVEELVDACLDEAVKQQLKVNVFYNSLTNTHASKNREKNLKAIEDLRHNAPLPSCEQKRKDLDGSGLPKVQATYRREDQSPRVSKVSLYRFLRGEKSLDPDRETSVAIQQEVVVQQAVEIEVAVEKIKYIPSESQEVFSLDNTKLGDKGPGDADWMCEYTKSRGLKITIAGVKKIIQESFVDKKVGKRITHISEDALLYLLLIAPNLFKGGACLTCLPRGFYLANVEDKPGELALMFDPCFVPKEGYGPLQPNINHVSTPFMKSLAYRQQYMEACDEQFSHSLAINIVGHAKCQASFSDKFHKKYAGFFTVFGHCRSRFKGGDKAARERFYHLISRILEEYGLNRLRDFMLRVEKLFSPYPGVFFEHGASFEQKKRSIATFLEVFFTRETVIDNFMTVEGMLLLDKFNHLDAEERLTFMSLLEKIDTVKNDSLCNMMQAYLYVVERAPAIQRYIQLTPNGSKGGFYSFLARWESFCASSSSSRLQLDELTQAAEFASKDKTNVRPVFYGTKGTCSYPIAPTDQQLRDGELIHNSTWHSRYWMPDNDFSRRCGFSSEQEAYVPSFSALLNARNKASGEYSLRLFCRYLSGCKNLYVTISEVVEVAQSEGLVNLERMTVVSGVQPGLFLLSQFATGTKENHRLTVGELTGLWQEFNSLGPGVSVCLDWLSQLNHEPLMTFEELKGMAILSGFSGALSLMGKNLFYKGDLTDFDRLLLKRVQSIQELSADHESLVTLMDGVCLSYNLKDSYSLLMSSLLPVEKATGAQADELIGLLSEFNERSDDVCSYALNLLSQVRFEKVCPEYTIEKFIAIITACSAAPDKLSITQHIVCLLPPGASIESENLGEATRALQNFMKTAHGLGLSGLVASVDMASADGVFSEIKRIFGSGDCDPRLQACFAFSCLAGFKDELPSDHPFALGIKNISYELFLEYSPRFEGFDGAFDFAREQVKRLADLQAFLADGSAQKKQCLDVLLDSFVIDSDSDHQRSYALLRLTQYPALFKRIDELSVCAQDGFLKYYFNKALGAGHFLSGYLELITNIFLCKEFTKEQKVLLLTMAKFNKDDEGAIADLSLIVSLDHQKILPKKYFHLFFEGGYKSLQHAIKKCDGVSFSKLNKNLKLIARLAQNAELSNVLNHCQDLENTETLGVLVEKYDFISGDDQAKFIEIAQHYLTGQNLLERLADSTGCFDGLLGRVRVKPPKSAWVLEYLGADSEKEREDLVKASEQQPFGVRGKEKEKEVAKRLDHLIENMFSDFGDENKEDCQIKLRDCVNYVDALTFQHDLYCGAKPTSKLSDKEIASRVLELRAKIVSETSDDVRLLLQLDFLTLAREAFYRNDNSHQGKFGRFAYTTQLLPVINNLLFSGSVTYQVPTGEGKSVVLALAAALKWAEGQPVDLVTSNTQLASRDYEETQSFFAAMGIKTSLIRKESLYEAYQQDGVNFSTAPELGIFQLKTKYDDYSLPKASLVSDEHDCLALDDGSTYNFAQTMSVSGKPNENPFAWIYLPIYRYAEQVKEKLEIQIQESRDDVTFDSPAEDVDKLRDFLQSSGLLNSEEIKQILMGDITEGMLSGWLDAAFYALQLKKDEHYVVEESFGEKSVYFYDKKAVDYQSRYSLGVHQMLEALEGATIKPESLDIASMTPQEFLQQYSSVTGATATPGETPGSVVKVGHRIKSKIKDLGLCIATESKAYGDEQHFTEIVKQLEEFRDRPVVIYMKNTADVYNLKKFIEKNMTSLPDGAVQEYTGIVSSNLKHVLKNAVCAGHITIANDSLARGTDFKLSVSDPGLVVMTTSADYSQRDEDQRIGRTARNGNAGSHIQVFSAAEVGSSPSVAKKNIEHRYEKHQKLNEARRYMAQTLSRLKSQSKDLCFGYLNRNPVAKLQVAMNVSIFNRRLKEIWLQASQGVSGMLANGLEVPNGEEIRLEEFKLEVDKILEDADVLEKLDSLMRATFGIGYYSVRVAPTSREAEGGEWKVEDIEVDGETDVSGRHHSPSILTRNNWSLPDVIYKALIPGLEGEGSENLEPFRKHLSRLNTLRPGRWRHEEGRIKNIQTKYRERLRRDATDVVAVLDRLLGDGSKLLEHQALSGDLIEVLSELNSLVDVGLQSDLHSLQAEKKENDDLIAQLREFPKGDVSSALADSNHALIAEKHKECAEFKKAIYQKLGLERKDSFDSKIGKVMLSYQRKCDLLAGRVQDAQLSLDARKREILDGLEAILASLNKDIEFLTKKIELKTGIESLLDRYKELKVDDLRVIDESNGELLVKVQEQKSSITHVMSSYDCRLKYQVYAKVGVYEPVCNPTELNALEEKFSELKSQIGKIEQDRKQLIKNMIEANERLQEIIDLLGVQLGLSKSLQSLRQKRSDCSMESEGFQSVEFNVESVPALRQRASGMQSSFSQLLESSSGYDYKQMREAYASYASEAGFLSFDFAKNCDKAAELRREKSRHEDWFGEIDDKLKAKFENATDHLNRLIQLQREVSQEIVQVNRLITSYNSLVSIRLKCHRDLSIPGKSLDKAQEELAKVSALSSSDDIKAKRKYELDEDFVRGVSKCGELLADLRSKKSDLSEEIDRVKAEKALLLKKINQLEEVRHTLTEIKDLKTQLFGCCSVVLPRIGKIYESTSESEMIAGLDRKISELRTLRNRYDPAQKIEDVCETLDMCQELARLEFYEMFLSDFRRLKDVSDEVPSDLVRRSDLMLRAHLCRHLLLDSGCRDLPTSSFVFKESLKDDFHKTLVTYEPGFFCAEGRPEILAELSGEIKVGDLSFPALLEAIEGKVLRLLNSDWKHNRKASASFFVFKRGFSEDGCLAMLSRLMKEVLSSAVDRCGGVRGSSAKDRLGYIDNLLTKLTELCSLEPLGRVPTNSRSLFDRMADLCSEALNGSDDDGSETKGGEPENLCRIVDSLKEFLGELRGLEAEVHAHAKGFVGLYSIGLELLSSAIVSVEWTPEYVSQKFDEVKAGFDTGVDASPPEAVAQVSLLANMYGAGAGAGARSGSVAPLAAMSSSGR